MFSLKGRSPSRLRWLGNYLGSRHLRLPLQSSVGKFAKLVPEQTAGMVNLLNWLDRKPLSCASETGQSKLRKLLTLSTLTLNQGHVWCHLRVLLSNTDHVAQHTFDYKYIRMDDRDPVLVTEITPRSTVPFSLFADSSCPGFRVKHWALGINWHSAYIAIIPYQHSRILV